MPRPFLLGPAEKRKIRMLREHAGSNPISLTEMQERAAAYAEGRRIKGFDAFTIGLPFGFRLTFTIEHHPPGLVRHMSMSVPERERVPHTATIGLVMEELGYINPLERCIVMKEPIDTGGIAINVIEPLDGNLEPFIRK